jgi:hypothetical protein
MNLLMGFRTVAHHSMRAYYVPAVAGALLVTAAFLPWVKVGEDSIGGLPSIAGFWILGLGALSTTFAILSIITRRNSRHPLLVVGLAALGIMFLAQRVMVRLAAERAWAAAQALAIVKGTEAHVPVAETAFGLYIGLAASFVIVLFGLTIVIRRVAQPYALTEDDDV